MTAYAVLISIFFLFAGLVIFFFVTHGLSKMIKDPRDGFVHYMKPYSPLAYCGKKREHVQVSVSDWIKVTCPDCQKHNPTNREN